MYRLAYNPCVDEDEKVFQKIVSEHLCAWMNTIFGTMNDDGKYTDSFRCKLYLGKCKYLHRFIDKKFKVGKGPLATEKDAEEFILSRYSDIYNKIADAEHEYTFDEFGEGLVYELIHFKQYGSHAYLSLFKDNEQRFKNEIESSLRHPRDKKCPAITLSPKDENCDEDLAELYNETDYIYDVEYIEPKDNVNLYDMFKRAGEAYYDDVIYDAYYDEDIDDTLGAPDKEDFIEFYADVWKAVITDVANYDGRFDMLEDHEDFYNIGDDGDTIISDLLFWDDDYMFIFDSLSEDTNTLNSFLKTVGVVAQYALNNVTDLFSGKQDQCYPI